MTTTGSTNLWRRAFQPAWLTVEARSRRTASTGMPVDSEPGLEAGYHRHIDDVVSRTAAGQVMEHPVKALE